MDNSDVTLDGLTIEIDSSAGTSSTGIDNLTASLDRLFASVSKNMSGLTRLTTALRGINASSKSFKFDTPTFGNMSMGGSIVDTDTTNKGLNTTMQKLGDIQGLKNSINKLPLDIVPDRTLEKVKNLQVYTKKAGNFSLQKVDMSGTIKQAERTQRSFSKIGRQAEKTNLSISAMINNFKKGLSVASSVGNTFGKVLSSIGKKLSFGLIPANKSLIKSFRQTVLALVGVRGLFTAIRKAISEYMNYDDELSESLRQNWAIIGSVVAPVIEKLVALVATLAAYITALIKTFFGVDIVARANQKALDGTSKKAKSTSKSVKDLADELGNLADFDKLHVINFDEDKSSSKSGIEPLSVGDVDTTWFDELKGYLDVNDWFALGVAVATKLEDGLRSIKWENIQSKLITITDNLVDFLNGFTYKIDGKLIGENLAQVFNTAFMTVNDFFENYKWDILGDKLHDGLKGFIEKIDWQSVGQFLANGFKAAIDVLYELFDPELFFEFGEKIGDTVNSWFDSIDWNKAGNTFSKGITSILKSIQGFLKKLNPKKVSNAINDFLAGVDWGDIARNIVDTIAMAFNSLSDILSGIDKSKVFNSIMEFMRNIDWSTLLTSLFDLVLQLALVNLAGSWGGVVGLFESLFKGIATEDIVPALIEGFVDALFASTTIIISALWGLINGVLETLGIDVEGNPSELFEDIGKSLIEGLKNGVSGIWDKIKEVFENFKDKIKEKFGEITDGIKEKFNIQNIKDHAKQVVDGIKEVFTKIPDWFRDKFSEAWTKVKSVFSKGGQMFEGIKGGVTSAFTDVANKLRDGLNWVIAKPFEGLNWILNKIKTISLFGIQPFYNAWGYDPVSVPQIPPLATGTNKIISEGIYHLHEGEAVVPKKYNPAVNNKLYDEKNNQMIAELQQMRKDIKNLAFTNIVKIGEDDIYKKQTSYDERKRTIYGTS